MLYWINLIAALKAALGTAAAWLSIPSSAATSSAASSTAARFDAIEVRLHALHQKAYAAAHAIAGQKHKYVVPAAAKNPRDSTTVKPRAGASRVRARVTILAPACDVPYAVARSELKHIGHRLMEIAGSRAHEAEAFILEKTVAEWERVLPALPGFVDERELAEAAWLTKNAAANEKALRFLRSCIPIDVSRQSEDELADLATPSGRIFPATLAFRLKDSPILQLVREDAKMIERMHPSVLRRLSAYGLTIVERRALFQVMQAPALAWRSQLKQQPSSELNAILASKLDWHQQLADELMRLSSSERVLACDLYNEDLGFPTQGCYAADVVKHGLP